MCVSKSASGRFFSSIDAAIARSSMALVFPFVFVHFCFALCAAFMAFSTICGPASGRVAMFVCVAASTMFIWFPWLLRKCASTKWGAAGSMGPRERARRIAEMKVEKDSGA